MDFGPREHAVMFGLLAKAILSRFGAEGESLLLSAVETYGMERGARMAARCRRNSDPTGDMASYFAYCEWSWTGSGSVRTGPDPSLPYLCYRMLECPWHAAWQESGLSAFGACYCRVVDRAILRGFDPTLRLELPSRLTEPGDTSCAFHWLSAENTPEFIERQRRLEQRLNGAQVRDFVYHTAHLRSTLLRCVEKRSPLLAAQAAAEADAAFARRFGHEALKRVLSAAGQDFLEV